MASSLPSFCSLSKSICKQKVLIKYPKVSSQSFQHEGKPANIVDANLSVLRERIEQVKLKERKTSFGHKKGWYYQSGYDEKHKMETIISESICLVGLVSGALGFVFLSGSLCICLVSLLVHLSKLTGC